MQLLAAAASQRTAAACSATSFSSFRPQPSTPSSSSFHNSSVVTPDAPAMQPYSACGPMGAAVQSFAAAQQPFAQPCAPAQQYTQFPPEWSTGVPLPGCAATLPVVQPLFSPSVSLLPHFHCTPTQPAGRALPAAAYAAPGMPVMAAPGVASASLPLPVVAPLDFTFDGMATQAPGAPNLPHGGCGSPAAVNVIPHMQAPGPAPAVSLPPPQDCATPNFFSAAPTAQPADSFTPQPIPNQSRASPSSTSTGDAAKGSNKPELRAASSILERLSHMEKPPPADTGA